MAIHKHKNKIETEQVYLHGPNSVDMDLSSICDKRPKTVGSPKSRRYKRASWQSRLGFISSRRNYRCPCNPQPDSSSENTFFQPGPSPARPGGLRGAFFIFIFFENIFYRNIFSISQFTVLYPYRPAGGRQGLICKLKKIICAGAPGGSLPPPWRAAGGRQAPCCGQLAVAIRFVLDMDTNKNHQ